MIKVTVNVIQSEDGRYTRELGEYSFPAVPRIDEVLLAVGETFTVRSVIWDADTGSVSVDVLSETYGHQFPMPGKS